MKKPSVFLGLIIATVVILSIVQVTVATNLSTTGVELSKLQNQLTAYQKQNELLEEKYLQASALINLDKKAQKIGFVPATNSHEYFSDPLPFAMNVGK
jgi:cell division protein FtsL